jgi:hypothetical protein
VVAIILIIVVLIVLFMFAPGLLENAFLVIVGVIGLAVLLLAKGG